MVALILLQLSFNPVTLVMFGTRNLVMGSGFLALPAAFVSTGMLLGTLVLFACMGLLRVSQSVCHDQ